MKLRVDTESDNKPSKQGQEPESRRVTGVKRLRCPNCGQHIFVAAESEPSEICQYCKDMTTWQLIEH